VRDEPIDVLLVTTSFPLAGNSVSGIFVERLVQGLPPAVRACVVTPASDQVTAERWLSGNGRLVPVAYAPRRLQKLAHAPGGIPVALRRRPWLWALVPVMVAALFIACLRRVRQSDVVHANWTACGVVGGLAARLMGRPVITTLRGEDVSRLETSRAHRWVLGLCAALSARLVVVSPHMRAALAAHLPAAGLAKVVHIPNGVDQALLELPLRSGRANAQAARRVLSVGALIPRKRMDTVIRAIAEPGTDDQLILVGEGAERPALHELARTLGVADRTRVAGAVAPAKMSAVYAQADIFVMASDSEGRSNALIEAMASGIPVVAANIPGVGDVIRERQTGLLFPVGDHAALARQLGELERSPELGLSMAGAARQWVRDAGLTWQATGARYADLYREVVARPRARRGA
jgi:glycosyltransferase involved in cell wall biosynthesis